MLCELDGPSTLPRISWVGKTLSFIALFYAKEQCVSQYEFFFKGEDPFSYGYGGTAKISQNCEFKDYGVPFQTNDVVGVYLVSIK